MTTPSCPVCDSKFSLDRVTMQCKVCGLPEDIRMAGPTAVARYKRKAIRRTTKTLESGIVVVTEESWQGKHASGSRKRNKHGRKGVRRA